MTLTTYEATPERTVTRAEIDRLTAIIEQLHKAIQWLNAGIARKDDEVQRLRHEIDVQRARAEVAEAMWRGRARGDANAEMNTAMHALLRDG